jgi:hypothetical protein
MGDAPTPRTSRRSGRDVEDCNAEQPENNETERGLRVAQHPRSWRALRPPTTPREQRSTSRSHEVPWDRACPGC